MCYTFHMRPEIVKFIQNICPKYNLKAIFIPDAHGMNDVWSITTPQGLAVMNFTTKIFYDISPRFRERMFLPTIKRGLNNVVAQSDIKRTQQQLIPRKMGKKII